MTADLKEARVAISICVECIQCSDIHYQVGRVVALALVSQIIIDDCPETHDVVEERAGSILMTPRQQRQRLNIVGEPRASQIMTADGNGGGGYRQPLGNLSQNSYARQTNSSYGMSAGAKAGKRPVRAFAATPQVDRNVNMGGLGDMPMR
jgi:hypothetical protein